MAWEALFAILLGRASQTTSIDTKKQAKEILGGNLIDFSNNNNN